MKLASATVSKMHLNFTNETKKSEVVGSFLEIAGDLLPDSFGLFTALIFCAVAVIAILINILFRVSRG